MGPRGAREAAGGPACLRWEPAKEVELRKLAFCFLAAAAVIVPATPAMAVVDHDVVVTGLNNPRQVDFAPSFRSLVIAEAGRGGSKCNDSGCYGRSGSVTRVVHPGQTTGASPTRVVRGLLSAAGPNGEFAVGPDGACSRSRNAINIAMTFAPPDVLPSGLPGRQAGKLLYADEQGDVRIRADITAVEQAQDPDGQGVDSNPYAVLCLPGRQIVADAAGNTLIEVRHGRAEVLTVLPNHNGVQSVPTSLTLGPDGNIYVGELAGEKAGVARIWKVSPGGEILGWTGGFTTIVGVDVTNDGAMWASELFGGRQGFGRLTRVAPDGTRSHRQVPLPGGLQVHLNKVYVAAWSVSDADGADLGGFQLEPGQLWRFRW